MTTATSAPHYKGYRFPSEIIGHAAWLYFHFSLSFRDVEELLAQRGIVVTYETVRKWCLTFGQSYANELRRRRPRCGDKWYMDEIFLTIRGESTLCGEQWIRMAMCWIFSCKAGETKKPPGDFFRKLLQGLQYVPRVIFTDKLKSYGAAKREILSGVEHRQHKGLNNRAENLPQPTRWREKKIRRFTSAFEPIAGHFQPRRHRLSAREYRIILQDTFRAWNEITAVK